MIPKIIHQTAPEDKKKWHPIWKACQKSWKTNFPESEYTHMMWNDDDLLNLVKEKFPEYLELYQSFPYHIIRVDFARFCILYEYGGIYADMDMFCYKNFYSYLTEDLYIVESWMEWEEIVQNSLMCSSRNNPFWITCMKTAKETENQSDDIEFKDIILKFCGPKMISKILDSSVNLLPRDVFNPMIKNQFNWAEKNYVSLLYSAAISDFNFHKNQEKEVVTRHYLTGNWPLK